MAEITVNGWPVPAGSAVTVVIRPGHPDQDVAVAAAEQLVTALTGKAAVTALDPQDTATVTAGRRTVLPEATPELTADQQLVEQLAAAYRAALASAAIAGRKPAVYEKLRQALRGAIEAAWNMRTVNARTVTDRIGDDARPVWAVIAAWHDEHPQAQLARAA
jgi:hypothetical protein